MSFFTTLGNKIGAVAHSIGQKAKHAIKRGTKFVHDHAKQVEDVAGVVSDCCRRSCDWCCYGWS